MTREKIKKIIKLKKNLSALLLAVLMTDIFSLSTDVSR